jgi:hypothetical protein
MSSSHSAEIQVTLWLTIIALWYRTYSLNFKIIMQNDKTSHKIELLIVSTYLETKINSCMNKLTNIYLLCFKFLFFIFFNIISMTYQYHIIGAQNNFRHLNVSTVTVTCHSLLHFSSQETSVFV